MPVLPSVPKVVRISLLFKVYGDNSAMSRFYVQYSGSSPTPAQLNTMCATIGTNWGTRFNALISPNVSLTGVTAEDLNSASGAVGGATTSQVGSNGGHAVAPGTSFNIGFTIARRYRGGKPKIFLPGPVGEDLLTGGTWSAGTVTAWTAAWAGFIADVLTAVAVWGTAGTHVNVSYFQGFTVVTNPVTHRARNVPTLRGAPVIDPVVSYSYEEVPGSQRRRQAD